MVTGPGEGCVHRCGLGEACVFVIFFTISRSRSRSRSSGSSDGGSSTDIWCERSL